jgi:N-methylhydantoinase A
MVQIAKVATIPSDPTRAIFEALYKAAVLSHRRVDEFLNNVGRLSYGTTLATNVLVQGKAAKVGLFITKGFADTLRIANMGREYLGIDLNCDRFSPPLNRRQIWEVTERVDASGKIILPLDAEEVKRGVEYFAELNVQAIAVCLLWAFKNPIHERRVGEIVRAMRPETLLSLSHEVAPILGEYERCVATVVNAMLGPPINADFAGFQEKLSANGVPANPLVLQSAGGVTPIERAAAFPVSLIGSGPAGGVTAALSLTHSLGIPDAICADMGGTSFDVCLIQAGVAESRLRTRVVGHTLAVPTLDVYSVGAGGGSVAWLDSGERLKVGPQSAGSVPGPVCYSRGGHEPTVTDANAVLGRLSQKGLVGGDLPLDIEGARNAIVERVASKLKMSAQDAALGICAIVDSSMANAIRVITVQKGLDPRDFALVAYGGAGPLHAVSLAEELSIPEVIVPFFATVFSAYGAVNSDVVHSIVRNLCVDLSSVGQLTQSFEEMEEEGGKLLESWGQRWSTVSFRRSAEMRYAGQSHEVAVSIPSSFQSADELRKIFEKTYSAQYGAGTTHSNTPVEVITARVDTVAKAEPRNFSLAAGDNAADAVVERRTVTFSSKLRDLEVPIYRGERLCPETKLSGGAVIEYYGTTVIIPPGWTVRVDGQFNLRVQRGSSNG